MLFRKKRNILIILFSPSNGYDKCNVHNPFCKPIFYQLALKVETLYWKILIISSIKIKGIRIVSFSLLFSYLFIFGSLWNIMIQKITEFVFIFLLNSCNLLVCKFPLDATRQKTIFFSQNLPNAIKGRRDRDRMVAGFTTTYAISAYHHWYCEFESRSGRGAQRYVIKFVSDVQQVGGVLRYSVSSTNKTDRHDIAEILLKVALSTIKQAQCNAPVQLMWLPLLCTCHYTVTLFPL